MMELAHLDAPEAAAVYDEDTEMVSTGAERPARRDQQVWPEGSGKDHRAAFMLHTTSLHECRQALIGGVQGGMSAYLHSQTTHPAALGPAW